MSGCGCGCGGQGFSYAANNCVPCRTNMFGQIPPTVCSAPCVDTSSFIRDAKLCCLAKAVSQSFLDLYDLLVGKTAQLAVMDTQKPLLITAMKDYTTATCDVDEIFTRDTTVNNILTAIKTSIDLLSADPNYNKYVDAYSVFAENVNNYFVFAASS